MGHVVTMALQEKVFTKTQHRSHIRCFCECQLFSCLVLCNRSAALTRDRVLHFLPRKKKFYSLNFHVIDIKHLFKAIDCYIIVKSVKEWVCVRACVSACARARVFVWQHHSRIYHTSPETKHFYVYIKRKCLSFL